MARRRLAGDWLTHAGVLRNRSPWSSGPGVISGYVCYADRFRRLRLCRRACGGIWYYLAETWVTY